MRLNFIISPDKFNLFLIIIEVTGMMEMAKHCQQMLYPLPTSFLSSQRHPILLLWLLHSCPDQVPKTLNPMGQKVNGLETGFCFQWKALPNFFSPIKQVWSYRRLLTSQNIPSFIYLKRVFKSVVFKFFRELLC